MTNEGRMLMFPLSQLPRLAKGKGNKIINVGTPVLPSGLNLLSP